METAAFLDSRANSVNMEPYHVLERFLWCLRELRLFKKEAQVRAQTKAINALLAYKWPKRT